MEAADKLNAVPGQAEVPNVEEYLKGFTFSGIGAGGRERLPIDAPDEQTLRRWLRQGHFDVTSIRPRMARAKQKNKISLGELADFVGQLADRRGAGQGEVEAIMSCARATSNRVLRRALADVAADLKNGLAPDESFARAREFNFRKNAYSTKEVFPREFIYMIRAGSHANAVGLLRDYEKRLRDALQIRKDAISELVYPAIVIAMAIVIIGVIMVFVIPGFKSIFEGLSGKDAELPFLTGIIVGASDLVASWKGLLIALLLGGGGYALRRWTKTPQGETWLQERNLFWRGCGQLLRLYHGHVALASLGQMMKSTEAVKALREAARGTPHLRYRRAFEAVATTVAEHGSGLPEAMRPYSALFGKDFYAALQTGAESGDVGEQVLKYAHQLGLELQKEIKRLMSLITPALTLLLGLIIGVTVVAMYLPMIQVIGKLSSN